MFTNLVISSWKSTRLLSHDFPLVTNVSNHHCVLFVSRNVFQDYLVCHLPRDFDGADWLVVLWILLVALYENKELHLLFSNLRNFIPSPWSFRDNWKWLCNDISQFPQLLWVHPNLSSFPYKHSKKIKRKNKAKQKLDQCNTQLN